MQENITFYYKIYICRRKFSIIEILKYVFGLVKYFENFESVDKFDSSIYL